MKREIATALAAAGLALTALAAAPAQAAPQTRVFGALPPSDPADVAEFRQQADALYRMKEKAFAASDAASVVNGFYAKDAVSFGPDGKPVIGRAEFMEEYERVVKIGFVKIEPVAHHVGKDAAWEWANFHVTPKNPQEKPFTFAMLFLWAKENGQWVCGGDTYAVGQFVKQP
ncbi:MAG TPA: nuclear transport factor 2 family protein [Phenylobacterium sp.]|uniref:YybH family protein n=1 Tax=Phenylobacterium sp. TaxID=1871053 RepID=UPI002B49F737|nr:nuclear transport factor 2 family protein [Phenylobacterium sp.]HKR87131.1 nuclear transport factor 2 family protein [Phenylobacterium sp.]HKT53378.1 nuclear transport factor 2 family protein [Caulobacteraceae bacterium]